MNSRTHNEKQCQRQHSSKKHTACRFYTGMNNIVRRRLSSDMLDSLTLDT